MATMSARRSGGWVFSVKVIVLSTAVLSTAVALKLAAPSIRGFVISEVPRIYGSLLAWLTPPYLYFVINIIIISIAASSRFHKAADGSEPVGSVAYHSQAKAPLEIRQEYVHVPQEEEAETLTECGIPADQYLAPAELNGGVEVPKPIEKEEEAVEEEFVISRSSWTPRRRESTEIPPEHSNLTEEKPLVSVRFGGRKSVKPSPEGKALGVARPKRNGTLENTWKTITDGRPIPLTRHLKKSDTFDLHVPGHAHREPSPVKKSETFNERMKVSASPSPGSGGGRLRKEPSLSQDELNRRVEAFINKFNEEMRLQRQDSFQQFQDMVNRGSH